MKLINKIIALSVLIAFTACSGDSKEPEGPVDKKPAKASVKVATKAPNSTGDSNELEGEATINNLTALVFDITGETLLGIKQETVSSEGEHTIADILVEEAGRVKIVIIANAPLAELNKVTNYTEAEALLADLSTQKQDYLTMSTQVINTQNELIAGEDNFIGFSDEGITNIDNIKNVMLTRIPARLQVKKISTNFSVSGKFAGRRVLVEEIYYENAKTKSHYFSAADWGKIEYEDANIYDNTKQASVNKYVFNGTPLENTGYVAYAMENSNEEKPVTLVVKATLAADEFFPEETKVFRSVINMNGIEKGVNHNYIRRNYVYNANLTFTDDSFEGTEEYLDIQVEVVAWGETSQETEF